MILRKYQNGDNKFELPVDRTKSETTKVMTGPIQNLKNKENTFDALKNQAINQAYKQLKRGSLNEKEYNSIVKEIKLSDNQLDLNKTFEKAQDKVFKATKTPVAKNLIFKDKERNEKFFNQIEEDNKKGVISTVKNDLLPNLGAATKSLLVSGDLSGVPANYELYKRYNVNYPTSGGYGDNKLEMNSGDINALESFNPFRSGQDLIYNLEDKDYGLNTLVNAAGVLPLFGKLGSKALKGLIKGGNYLQNATTIPLQGLTRRQANNALLVNNTVNTLGAGVKYTGLGAKYNVDNALDLAGFGGAEKNVFKSEIDWNKWNPDISKNKPLLDEYHMIELESKANNSWMKNPDGSEFKGTPEQFVQQNRINTKSAIGNNEMFDMTNPNIYQNISIPENSFIPGSLLYHPGNEYILRNTPVQDFGIKLNIKNLPTKDKHGFDVSENEINQIINQNLEYINHPNYIKRRQATTGESPEKIKKEIQKYTKDLKNIEFDFDNTTTGAQGEHKPAIKILGKTLLTPKLNISSLGNEIKTKYDFLHTLDHEIKHALSPASQSTFSGMPKYKNYPHLDLVKDGKNSAYYNKDYEQQVRFLRIKDYIKNKYNISNNEELTPEQFDLFANDWNEWAKQKHTGAGDNKVPRGMKDIKGMLSLKGKDVTRDDLRKLVNKAWLAVPTVGTALLNRPTEKRKFGGILLKKYSR
jgi:hypothetical protein